MKYDFKKWNAFYPYLILFLGTIIVLLTSPLAPFANKLTGADSGVYIYCSEQILKGKIIYKELFDHKGPLLYLINMAGLVIGGGNTVGIWFVELVLLFGALIYIYKSATLYFDKFIALISSLSCLLLFFPLFGRGNITEEYVVPFISVSLYYFLHFFKYRSINKYHFAIIAFCCTCAFLLKPNFISLWIIGYLSILIILLKDKRSKEMFSISLVSLAAFFAACLPFAVYFSYTDSWADFKFCFWDFNKAYSDVSISGVLLRTCRRFWYAGHFWLSRIGRVHVILFIFIGVVYFKHLIHKVETFFIFFAIILTNLMISIGSYDFLNYYVPFVPLFGIPYALSYYLFVKKLRVSPKLIICVIFLLFGYGCFRQMKDVYSRYIPMENLLSFITENSEKTDKITVVGHDCSIYTLSGRESVSKYSYQFPIIEVKQYEAMIAERYMNDLAEGKPCIVLTRIPSSAYEPYFKNLNDFLDTNYEKVITTDPNYHYWLLKH